MKPLINFFDRLNIKDIISKLYGNNQFNIDLRNRNPYRIVLKEEKCMDIFYFSSPIFSYKSGKLVCCNWVGNNGKFVFEGVNAFLNIDRNSIILENQIGSCIVSFNKDINIAPTLNGILVESKFVDIEVKLYFRLSGRAIYNSSFLAYVSENLPPFLVFNSLFAKKNDELFPVEIICNQIDDNTFKINFHTDRKIEKLYFDINLYLSKLIFDTTVSSKKKNENNIYGEIAFLGSTDLCGKEWLYARFNAMKLENIQAQQVLKAYYYIPCFIQNNKKLKLNVLTTPWCSFGTTGENKIETEQLISYSENIYNYKRLEVTNVIKGILKEKDSRNLSLLIKQDSNIGNTIVATGDNYINPQILRIKIKGDIFDGNN